MFKEFKEFAVRGNVVDMAVGIIIGGAFGTIVSSMVSDIIMPPIGLALGKVDFSNLYFLLREGASPGPYVSLEEARAAGAVSLNYGMFVNNLVSFAIVAFSVFLLVKGLNKIKREQVPEAPAAATVKECPRCVSKVDIRARRCPFCTSELDA